ncbi:aminotransferase [Pendulispora rubella]|uniref:Aminotransferase n=1 Tax=Pendulispora rubella TaxID=2741070 RepID=A0ABZ2LHA0_9BACT
MSSDVPAGWPRISSALFYDDAPAAIDWLGRAFGFVTRLKVEGDDGSIVHSELEYQDGLIMVGSTSRGTDGRKSPRAIDGVNTQSLFVYVKDVEAHYARAKAAGAKIAAELETKNYGDEHGVDRGYAAIDCEGHHWWFAQRTSTPKKQTA